jgi:hypothetical protein
LISQMCRLIIAASTFVPSCQSDPIIEDITRRLNAESG